MLHEPSREIQERKRTRECCFSFQCLITIQNDLGTRCVIVLLCFIELGMTQSSSKTGKRMVGCLLNLLSSSYGFLSIIVFGILSCKYMYLWLHCKSTFPCHISLFIQVNCQTIDVAWEKLLYDSCQFSYDDFNRKEESTRDLKRSSTK